MYMHLPNECVDFSHVNVVELLYGLLDLRLVGSQVDNKHQRVVVLNLLHRTLCRQRVLDDSVLVQFGTTGDTLAGIFRPSPTLEGLGTVEVYRGADLGFDFGVHAFQYRLLGLQRVRFRLCDLASRDGLTYGERGH